MKRLRKYLMLAAAMLAAGVQVASAQVASAPARPRRVPTLYGTLGACNNAFAGGPCTETSVFVELDATTGAVIDVLGPVGYTVNGLAWDRTSKKLYATTAIGDVSFHGLITIDPLSGKGTPVNAAVHNFGLAGGDSPIHSVVINPQGQMVAWYDEFPPGAGDTFVTINKFTGIATEFAHPGGLDTHQNGLAFQAIGPLSVLWNIDFPSSPTSQTAYVINPRNGNVLLSRKISPPTMAALGDFHPFNLQYYGVNFVPFDPTAPASITVVDVIKGTVKTLGPTDHNLHVIAFVKP